MTRANKAANADRNWKALNITGTTRNFRWVYLQRLANPRLAYNETTNPYRTVDRMSVDITAFNGVEETPEPVTPTDPGGGGDATADVEFKTYQRGIGENKTQAPLIAPNQRSLWRHESIVERPNPVPDPELAGTGHIFGYELKHSLGYLNFPYGLPFDTTTAPNQKFVGFPQTEIVAGGTITETRPAFPWLNWNNRPFSAAAELLQVPYARASRLLDDFSYPGQITADTEYKNATKGGEALRGRSASFGHLLDFFGTNTDDSTPLSPHWYRLFDFIEVRSPFADVEERLNEAYFGYGNDTNFSGAGYRFPLNYVSRFRNPGKVNINTVMDNRVWLSVNAGFPPAVADWPTMLLSRRGAPNAALQFPHASYPTMFANPFRPAASATLMPDVGSAANTRMTKKKQPVEATFLRPRPTASGLPGDKPLWLYESPLPYNDTNRNPAFRYQGVQRMENLVTTQSNVYAIWLTIGYFEVNPETGQLGQEMGTDTGDIKRHRAFYIIDRSIPVAFEPGQNHNVDRCVVLRRMIE